MNLYDITSEDFLNSFNERDIQLKIDNCISPPEKNQKVMVVDIDDVICDFRKHFNHWLYKKYNIFIDPNSTSYYSSKEVKDHGYSPEGVFEEFINQNELLNIPVIPQMIQFLNLAKKLHLKELAEEIFQKKAKLCGLDFYYNPRSEDPVLDWHCDTSYSGKKIVEKFIHPKNYSIKFFFYLTDVSKDNGCLSYIPGSNRIAYAIKKGVFEGNIKYTPYWSLKDFRKTIQIKSNYEYIKKITGEKDLSEFLNRTSFAENQKAENYSFDHEMKKGGAVIFDEAGIHRGSRTRLNDRVALRFFYKQIY